MFTYRDFEGGTLGLAWTGDLKNAGGVCEKNGVISLYCHVTGQKEIKKKKHLCTALSRKFEKFEYGDRYAVELRETRPTCRFSRHFGPRNWPQFRLAGNFTSRSIYISLSDS